jgi:LmbE family N-acetylglucosaminyl deacetylase
VRDLHLPAGPLQVVTVGAHPDDVEIGCGGTLLALRQRPGVEVHGLVLTGSPERQLEAEDAAVAFNGTGAGVTFGHLPDSRLPDHWSAVKDVLEDAARSHPSPDLVLAPRRDDSHQDHRLLAELVPTVWRDSLVLHYEIPKWDGDLGRVTHYVPLDAEQARLKAELLTKVYPSQVGRDWWDDETFLALMRLRGVECRAPYAEGFLIGKARLDLVGSGA